MPTLADSVISDLQRPLEHERHRAYDRAARATGKGVFKAGKTVGKGAAYAALTAPDGLVALAGTLKRFGVDVVTFYRRETIIIGGPDLGDGRDDPTNPPNGGPPSGGGGGAASAPVDPMAEVHRRELLAFCKGRKIRTWEKGSGADGNGPFEIQIEAAHSEEVHDFLRSREARFASRAGATITLDADMAEAHGPELTAYLEGLGVDADVRDGFGLLAVDLDAKAAKKVEKFLTDNKIQFVSSARREDEVRYSIPVEETRLDGEDGSIQDFKSALLASPEEAEAEAAILVDMGFEAIVHDRRLFFRGEDAGKAYASIKEIAPEAIEKAPSLDELAEMNGLEAPTESQLKFARDLGIPEDLIACAATRDAMTVIIDDCHVETGSAYDISLNPEREMAAREAIAAAKASRDAHDDNEPTGPKAPPAPPNGPGSPPRPPVPPSTAPKQGKDLFERAQEAARNEDIGWTREHPQDIQAQPPAHDSDPSTPWPDGADAPGSGDKDHDGIPDNAEDRDGDGTPDDMEPAPYALDESLDSRCQNAVQCASTARTERADPEIGDPDEVR